MRTTAGLKSVPQRNCYHLFWATVQWGGAFTYCHWSRLPVLLWLDLQGLKEWLNRESKVVSEAAEHKHDKAIQQFFLSCMRCLNSCSSTTNLLQVKLPGTKPHLWTQVKRFCSLATKFQFVISGNKQQRCLVLLTVRPSSDTGRKPKFGSENTTCIVHHRNEILFFSPEGEWSMECWCRWPSCWPGIQGWTGRLQKIRREIIWVRRVRGLTIPWGERVSRAKYFSRSFSAKRTGWRFHTATRHLKFVRIHLELVARTLLLQRMKFPWRWKWTPGSRFSSWFASSSSRPEMTCLCSFGRHSNCLRLIRTSCSFGTAGS